MYGHDTLFLYFTRRAQQEQIAAINASSPAAATVHRTLSTFHAAKALLAVATETGSDERRAETHPILDGLVVVA